MIKYTINIAAITLKNFSADFKIFSICFLSFFAIGPYKADFITGPIPASNRVIYAKNCVIDETSPLTFEPIVMMKLYLKLLFYFSIFFLLF